MIATCTVPPRGQSTAAKRRHHIATADSADVNLNISGIDLAIVVALLVGMVAFGMWKGRKQEGIADYLLGNRDLPTWLLLLSIVATETSAATFLSVPGLSYAGNMTFLQLAMGYVLGRYVVVRLLLPLYFRGEMFTAYQVLSERFGGATKQAASLLFMITRSLADGMRLLLAAIVLKIILFPHADATPAGGFDVSLSLAVAVMGVTTIIFTFFGGMKAVIWTDAIQFFIYLLGAIVAGVVILSKLPHGFESLIAYGQAHDKLTVFDLDWDLTKPFTLWAGVIGGAFFSLGSHGADQLMVQRYLSARGLPQASRALLLSGWIVLAQFAMFLLLGIGLACFFEGRQFSRNDEVFARFIVEELPVGAVGLVVAAVFAAAFTSSLNASAAAAVNDFYIPLFNPKATSQQAMRVTRGLTIFFGVVQITVGICGQYLNESVVSSVLSIAGFTTGIILGVFFLGIFALHVGQRAALLALLLGLAGMTAIKFLTPLAWPWFVLVGSLGTFAIGWLAGWLMPRK